MTVERNAHATDFVNSQMQEAVKTYSVFDGSNRLSIFYTAATDAKHGDRCMITTYIYDGATTRVVKTKESLATWNSTWDI